MLHRSMRACALNGMGQRWRESENFEVEFQTYLSNVSKIAKGFDLFMAFSEMNATTNLLLDITAVF